MINYYLLTKPGIIFGNLMAFAAGFILGGHGEFDIRLFLLALLGLACIMASGCVCNNYIDKEADSKMARTKQRPLVQGTISDKNALLFAAALFAAGSILLVMGVNWLSFILTCIGFFAYVVLYSMWKGKTVYGTAIGSISGAIPPVVGYCAASNQLDLPAFLLFMILVLWQMPHFFAIALLHLDDYSKAGIPVLPLVKGVQRTKIHMAAYITGFILAVALLTWWGYLGQVFLWTTGLLGLGWLLLCLTGFRDVSDKKYGKQMFAYSLIVMGALCLIIPFDLGPQTINSIKKAAESIPNGQAI